MALNPRPWVVPAGHALRTYWLTGLMLSAVGALGLALILPVTSLVGADGISGASRLLMWAMPWADTGLHWSELARTPATSGQLVVGRSFDLLLLGAGFALAVAGLTILTFSAVREGQREVDLSIRRAVGGSKRMLLRAVELESAILILAAILFGGGLGSLGAAAAIRTWPGVIGAGQMGATLVAVAALAGGIVFGAVVPVLFARTHQVAEAVSRPVPLAIPALQLGLTLAVLTAAGLVSRNAVERSPETAANQGRVLYQIDASGLTAPERSLAYGNVIADLNRQGWTASLAGSGSLLGLGTVDMIVTNCGDCHYSTLPTRFRQVMTTQIMVSADTFRALGVNLVAGRLLTDQDRAGAQRVVVINRAMAAETFQYGQPLGRELRVSNDDRWYTVVGVVDDAPHPGFGAGVQPRYSAYFSVQQQPPASVELITDPARSEAVIASRVRAVSGKDLSVTRLAEADLLAMQAAPIMWLARRFAIQGWGMLALAAAALLALMRLWIASLQTELGVRRALGATRFRLWRMILGRTAMVGIAGTVVGMWFGPAIWIGLREVLPGLPNWDLGLLIDNALVLLAAASAGAVVPAYLALRRTPAELIDSHGS